MRLALIALAVGACYLEQTPPQVPRRPSFFDKSGGPVVVVGAVVRPTVVPWYPGMGIRYAVRAAGGTTVFATRLATVTRRERGVLRRILVPYERLPEVELAPGDVVHVRERH